MVIVVFCFLLFHCSLNDLEFECVQAAEDFAKKAPKDSTTKLKEIVVEWRVNIP